eukprot:Filipodium_phascolosomae@DN3689_c0_g1_i1.p1
MHLRLLPTLGDLRRSNCGYYYCDLLPTITTATTTILCTVKVLSPSVRYALSFEALQLFTSSSNRSYPSLRGGSFFEHPNVPPIIAILSRGETVDRAGEFPPSAQQGHYRQQPSRGITAISPAGA